jgi:transposase
LSQPTQDQCVQFQVESDASRLFGLEGLAVARVVTDGVQGRVVHLVTADETAAGCPSCGVISLSVKGRVVSRPRDLPHGPAGLSVVWHKRRWRCAETACARRSFTESLPVLPARARLTTRLRAELGSAVADSGRTVAEVAAFHRIGWPTVHRAFIDRVTPALSAPLPPVTVLGIDETRRGKQVFARDPDTGRWVVVADRWHTGFVDAAGTGGPLAQVEGRSAAAGTLWLAAQPAPWRPGIRQLAVPRIAGGPLARPGDVPEIDVAADPRSGQLLSAHT